MAVDLSGDSVALWARAQGRRAKQGAESTEEPTLANRETRMGREFEEDEAHCRGRVQFVPPVGSALISPCWSMQKPRCPVLPTAWGTAVAS